MGTLFTRLTLTECLLSRRFNAAWVQFSLPFLSVLVKIRHVPFVSIRPESSYQNRSVCHENNRTRLRPVGILHRLVFKPYRKRSHFMGAAGFPPLPKAGAGKEKRSVTAAGFHLSHQRFAFGGQRRRNFDYFHQRPGAAKLCFPAGLLRLRAKAYCLMYERDRGNHWKTAE